MEPLHLRDTRTDEDGKVWEIACCRKLVPLKPEHTKGSGLGTCYGEYQHLDQPPLIAPDGSQRYLHYCTYCGNGKKYNEGLIDLEREYPYLQNQLIR